MALRGIRSDRGAPTLFQDPASPLLPERAVLVAALRREFLVDAALQDHGGAATSNGSALVTVELNGMDPTVIPTHHRTYLSDTGQGVVT